MKPMKPNSNSPPRELEAWEKSIAAQDVKLKTLAATGVVPVRVPGLHGSI
jgi:hypothetical protein